MDHPDIKSAMRTGYPREAWLRIKRENSIFKNYSEDDYSTNEEDLQDECIQNDG